METITLTKERPTYFAKGGPEMSLNDFKNTLSLEVVKGTVSIDITFATGVHLKNSIQPPLKDFDLRPYSKFHITLIPTATEPEAEIKIKHLSLI